MLDFDMLASGNYARFIYDGNGDEQGFAGPERLGPEEVALYGGTAGSPSIRATTSSATPWRTSVSWDWMNTATPRSTPS